MVKYPTWSYAEKPAGLLIMETLLGAAQVRNQIPLLEIARNVKSNTVPQVFYHRKGGSLFTMKKDLQTITQKAEASASDDAGMSECTSKHLNRRMLENLENCRLLWLANEFMERWKKLKKQKGDD